MKIGVYILLCANSRFYVGSTNNLEDRIKRHSSGWVKSTKNILPITLCAFVPFEDLKEARKFEYKVKKMKSRKFIEQIINGYPVQSTPS